MRKFVLLSLLLSTLLTFAEPITNVRAVQEGRKIVLLYDLSSNQRVIQVNILINERQRVIPLQFLSGDINKDVWQGKDRRIVYDVLADYADGLVAEVEFLIFTEQHFAPQPQPTMPQPQPTIPQPQPTITQPQPTVPEERATSHRAVDLGLSVRWAAYNVGANTPLETGDYFAWGETEPKNSYTQSNYSMSQFKDAAATQWEGDWRIPTIAEWKELQEHCTWKWGQLDGVHGYKITSNRNGNSIFLPAAGYKEGYTISDRNQSGCYWLELVHPSDANYARSLYFDANKEVLIVNRLCFTGRCIRAVCP